MYHNYVGSFKGIKLRQINQLEGKILANEQHDSYTDYKKK